MRFVFSSGEPGQSKSGVVSWVTRWLVSAVGLALVVRFVHGVSLAADSAPQALLLVLGAAAVLGLLNRVLKPLLLIVTLPVNILTLGLFTLVINGAVLWLATAVVPAFSIANFRTAVWAAFCLSVFTLLLNALFGGAVFSVDSGRRR